VALLLQHDSNGSTKALDPVARPPPKAASVDRKEHPPSVGRPRSSLSTSVIFIVFSHATIIDQAALLPQDDSHGSMKALDPVARPPPKTASIKPPPISSVAAPLPKARYVPMSFKVRNSPVHLYRPDFNLIHKATRTTALKLDRQDHLPSTDRSTSVVFVCFSCNVI
jgi:hypothetical protein